MNISQKKFNEELNRARTSAYEQGRIAGGREATAKLQDELRARTASVRLEALKAASHAMEAFAYMMRSGAGHL